MTLSEFEKLYGRRLRKYAQRLTYDCGLPSHMKEDLYQACWLVIGRLLKKWSPTGGMSAYNFCCSDMRREMIAEFRRYHGNRGFGWRVELRHVFTPLGDREGIAEDANLDLKIDMQRILENQPKTRNLEHFLRMSVGQEHGAEVAKDEGLTRQVVNHHCRRTRAALKEQFAEFADEAPSLLPESRRSIAWENK